MLEPVPVKKTPLPRGQGRVGRLKAQLDSLQARLDFEVSLCRTISMAKDSLAEDAGLYWRLLWQSNTAWVVFWVFWGLRIAGRQYGWWL